MLRLMHHSASSPLYVRTYRKSVTQPSTTYICMYVCMYVRRYIRTYVSLLRKYMSEYCDTFTHSNG